MTMPLSLLVLAVLAACSPRKSGFGSSPTPPTDASRCTPGRGTQRRPFHVLAIGTLLLGVALAAMPISTAHSASDMSLNSGQELIALRTATAKHYYLGGNRYLAVISAEPVHFQDEKGLWQEKQPAAPIPNEPASTAISIDAGGDTYISEQYPGSGGFGHLDYLRVTNTGVYWWDEHALLYFDLSSIPSSDGYDGDKTILDARLELYVRDIDEYAGASVQVDLYALTADWAEADATWNDRDDGVPWSNPGGDYDQSGPVSQRVIDLADEGDFVEWPVQGIVEAWHLGAVPNHGLLIKSFDNESYVDYVEFASKEYSDGPCTGGVCAPRLYVEYQLTGWELTGYEEQLKGPPDPAQHFRFTYPYNYWQVVGINPSPGDDNALQLYSDPDYGVKVAESNASMDAVDFVLVNGDVLGGGRTYYPRVFGWTSTGDYPVEWAEGDTLLGDGGLGPYTMGPNDVVRVWDTQLLHGTTYYFSVLPISGDADLGVGLFSPSAGDHQDRFDAAAEEYYTGGGEPEFLHFTAGATGYHGLVVWNSAATTATQFAVYRDTTEPICSFQINNGDQYTNDPNVTLNASASDPETGVYQMLYFNGDYSGHQSYSPSYPWTLSAGDGPKTLYGGFQNHAGMWSQYLEGDCQDTIILDQTGPQSSISSVPDPATSAPVSIPWTASDNLSGVSSVELYVLQEGGTWSNSGLAPQSGTSGTFQFTPPADGRYYVQTVATDGAGNREAVPSGSVAAGQDFMYDANPPASEVDGCPAQANGTFSVHYTATDGTGSGLNFVNLWYRKDGGSWVYQASCGASTSGYCSFTPSGGSGIYYLATRAQDLVGWQEAEPDGSGDCQTLYDTTEPTSTITDPPGPGYYNAVAVSTIRGSASDGGGSGLLKVEVKIKYDNTGQYWNGISWQAGEAWLEADGTTNWSYPGPWQNGNSYTIWSRAEDNAHVVQDPPDSVQFVYDDLSPTSAIVSPGDGGYRASLNEISGTASDASTGGTGVVAVDVSIRREDGRYWDGDSWSTTESWLAVTGGSSWTFHSDGVDWLSGYQYTVRSRAEDGASNEEIPGAGHSFSWDGVPPWSWVSPPADQVGGNISMLFNTGDTGGSGVDFTRLWVRFDGGSWADNGLTDDSTTGFFTYVPTSGAGSYCFQSIARDVAGNTESGPSGDGDGCTNYGTSTTNNPPTLVWTGEPNYVADGLHPESGETATGYVYRVTYRDADGDAPSYVQVDIKKGGASISGSPFTMSCAGGDYAVGVVCSYTQAGLAAGTDYAYQFMAHDGEDAALATTEKDAPDVSSPNQAPVLSWTGEANYISDGLHPESGGTGDSYGYRIQYTDPDGDAPGYVRVYIQKGGVDLAGSPFAMTCASGDYASGVVCAYTKPGLVEGTDYTYQFVAEDSRGAPAVPTAELDAPDVAGAATAAFPFYDGFELGVLDPVWTSYTTGDGRVRVEPSYAHSGAYSLQLDDAVAEGYSHAAATLTIDLSGQSNVYLDFWWQDLNNEEHPEDGVFVSADDGANWYKIFAFTPGSTGYQRQVLDLTAAATGHGIALNDHFQIRFQFYDNWYLPSDGYAIDEVQVRPNTVPVLSWTGEAGYESDGLYPESGGPNTDYAYHIRYADAYGDPPDSAQLHIRKGGGDISGSPFTLSCPSGDYKVGVICSYTASGLDPGSDYSYLFVATDNLGTAATPTTVLDAPDVEPVPVASFPICDDFETGSLGEVWTVETTNEGRVRVDSGYAVSGSYSLLLDDEIGDSTYSTSAAVLTVDLVGQSQVDLEFWWRSFSDWDDGTEGVYFSDDWGATWVRVMRFAHTLTSFNREVLDVDGLAAAHGLALNNHFQIRFQSYGSYPIPFNGHAVDAVCVQPASNPEPGQLQAPALVAPADGDNLCHNRPAMNWDVVSGATSYRIQVDDALDFASPLISTTTTATSYAPDFNPAKDVTYHWRVRATHGPLQSAWSETRSYKILQSSPPDVVTLLSPLEGVVTNTLPLLSWSPVAGYPEGYRFELTQDPTFASVERSGTVGGTSWQASSSSPLHGESQYYWRVRPNHCSYIYGNWSATGTFTTACVVDPVLLAAPADDSTIGDVTPILQWNGVSDADWYTVTVDTDPGFGSPYVETTTSGTSYALQAGEALSPGEVYYWQVQPYKDGCGPGDLSGTWSLSVGDVAPVPFFDDFESGELSAFWATITSAEGVAEVDSGSPYPGSYWLALYPKGLSDGDQLAAAMLALDLSGQSQVELDFELWVGWYNTLGDGNLYLSNDGGSSWSSSVLTFPSSNWQHYDYTESFTLDLDQIAAAHGLSLTQDFQIRFEYYGDDAEFGWQGYAIDNVLVWSPPLTPTLLSPPDGTVLSLSSDPVVYFSWSEAGGATSYNLQVDDDASFDSPLIQDITTANSYVPSPPLDLGAYHWRVQGCNESGCGPWSAAWAFTKAALLSDNFSEALDIVGAAYSSMQDTTKATNQAQDPAIPCIGHAGYHTVWYRFTAPSDGTLLVDTLTSSYDTVLAVWTGDWGALQSVGCDNDGGGAQAGASQIKLTLSEGMTYNIEVAGTAVDQWGVVQLHTSFRSGHRQHLPLVMKQH